MGQDRNKCNRARCEVVWRLHCDDPSVIPQSAKLQQAFAQQRGRRAAILYRALVAVSAALCTEMPRAPRTHPALAACSWCEQPIMSGNDPAWLNDADAGVQGLLDASECQKLCRCGDDIGHNRGI
jgi:hypothetical protein